MTASQNQPLTYQQVYEVLRESGAPYEALVSSRESLDELTAAVNALRAFPLDLQAKLALITASSDGAPEVG